MVPLTELWSERTPSHFKRKSRSSARVKPLETSLSSSRAEACSEVARPEPIINSRVRHIWAMGWAQLLACTQASPQVICKRTESVAATDFIVRMSLTQTTVTQLSDFQPCRECRPPKTKLAESWNLQKTTCLVVDWSCVILNIIVELSIQRVYWNDKLSRINFEL